MVIHPPKTKKKKTKIKTKEKNTKTDKNNACLIELHANKLIQIVHILASERIICISRAMRAHIAHSLCYIVSRESRWQMRSRLQFISV